MVAPDVETVLVPWLESTLSVHVCTETPADLETILPVVQVERVGGATPRFSDTPRVDVDVYAGDADAAMTLARAAQNALLALRGLVGDAVIRDVRCDSGPSRRPYVNPAIAKRGATYTLSLRAA
ncbi:hypothetical protein [Streptomyces chryseus]|uniref:hypothetical protein n=1 Tax=Streptomyces chryseus TaxID=68186 RepID=UPI00110FA06F|nr:hypothetical protein [Streptomyces chryseus]GGX26956.1 hypothetical protein GCM10010353_47710 [Streptomyces chryseus]